MLLQLLWTLHVALLVVDAEDHCMNECSGLEPSLLVEPPLTTEREAEMEAKCFTACVDLVSARCLLFGELLAAARNTPHPLSSQSKHLKRRASNKTMNNVNLHNCIIYLFFFFDSSQNFAVVILICLQHLRYVSSSACSNVF